MLYNEKVTLNQENHTYTDKEGLVYMGFSSFYNEFLFKKFDAEFMAGRIALASDGATSRNEVLEKWEAAKDLGCYYDKALEECAENEMCFYKYPEIEAEIKSILKEYDHLWKCFQQKVVYNEHYRIAGSPDKFGLTSNRKDGSFEMSDFKVFQKDDLHIARGWLNEPLNHLPATKFIKIALQLSFYAFQLEELLGKRCKALYIHLIDPVLKSNRKVYVPYMKNDILLCLETFQATILENVNKKNVDSLF